MKSVGYCGSLHLALVHLIAQTLFVAQETLNFFCGFPALDLAHALKSHCLPKRSQPIILIDILSYQTLRKPLKALPHNGAAVRPQSGGLREHRGPSSALVAVGLLPGKTPPNSGISCLCHCLTPSFLPKPFHTGVPCPQDLHVLPSCPLVYFVCRCSRRLLPTL